MKRKEILKKLSKLGFTLVEGGNHTKIYKDDVYLSCLSRQAEIKEHIVLKIEKQLKITLR